MTTHGTYRRSFYAGDTYISITVDDVADFAGKMWDAGLVEYVGKTYASEYLDRMLTATVETLLWADAEHDCPDARETGDCEHRDELRFGYAPTYEDALKTEDRRALAADVEGFVRGAWPYLSADGIEAEQAGHDFHLSRCGHGTGFWDRGGDHNNDLDWLADTYGTIGVFWSDNEDGEVTDVSVHH